MPQAALQSTTTRVRKHPSRSRPAAPLAPQILNPDDLPDLYAMVVKGDCLAPTIGDSYIAGFSKSEPIEPNDFVILFLRPELVLPGRHQCAIKRLVLAPPRWVTFPYVENPASEVQALVITEQLNPHHSMATKCADLIAIHKCIGWRAQ
jgi:hypothetical protein